jgi:pre-mRNA-processing factor 19
MSLSTCAFTGNVLITPVISKKSGYIFEKDAIEKQIDTTGQCPITGEELSKDDLLEINLNHVITPKPGFNNTNNSLNKLQIEWENLILENFNTKKQLEQIRKEISQYLFQHEAANLVITRLIKEKDEAILQLNTFKNQLEELKDKEEENKDENEEFDYMGIYPELIERITELSSILSKERKGRKISPELLKVEQIQHFKVKNSHPLHSTTKPGITSINIHPLIDNLIVTGGNDGKAVLFDNETEKVLNRIENAHTKKINCVNFYPGKDIIGFITASVDNKAAFWIRSSNINDLSSSSLTERYRINNHTGSITGISFHPLKEYCLFGSKDKTWSIHSLFKGVCLIKQKTEGEINSIGFQPDGKIYFLIILF